jgi:hypothetical protein
VTDDEYQFKYDGLVLSGDSTTVYGIEAVGKNYCTPAGICPGTAMAEVERRLGKPLDSDSVREGRNEYLVNAEACWLRIDESAGFVSKLSNLCQP